MLRRFHRAVIDRLPVAQKRAVLYLGAFGRLPRMRAPRTFMEKVNWRVVHDRRPVIAMMGDKLASKEHVARTCPAVSVAKACWSGTDLSELADVQLPARWVLKPNHGTGDVYFGEGRPDVALLQQITDGWLEERLWQENCQWAYTRAQRVLLVEERLGAGDEPPADYKFLVYDGVPRFVSVDTGRFGADHRRSFYTVDWEPLPIESDRVPGPAGAPPENLTALVEAAAALGAGLDFVRVDLYDIDGVVWFGELTPYPGAGLDKISPRSYDRLLGEPWQLPPRSAVLG